MKIETIQIHWSEVKARVLATLEDGKRWKQPMQGTLMRLRQDPTQIDSFYGGSAAQTIDWARNGFYAPELEAATDRIPVASMPRAGWAEEPSGDIELSRLYGGYDDYYFEVAERDLKPGLRLEVDLFFAALVKTKTVGAYGAWVAGLVAALEQAGYDLGIDLVCPVTALHEGRTRSQRTDMLVTVKQPGELSDFAGWSVAFSPIGTRVMMFTAFGVASDQIGQTQTSHMAMSLPSDARSFGVEYDTVENVLRITADQRWSGDFPAERMNAALEASGLM